MCFSATASFTVAAIAGAAGVASLTQVTRKQDLLLAAFPLLFGAQQAVEGMLWLALGAEIQDPALQRQLAGLFVFFAEVFWPTAAPLAVLLTETERYRVWALQTLTLMGFVTSIYLLTSILQSPYEATILGHSIHYHNGYGYFPNGQIVYVLCTVLPFLLSSGRMVQLLGLTIFAGYGMTLQFYSEALVSVWCFFAAIASALIYLHVARLAPQRAQNPVPQK